LANEQVARLSGIRDDWVKIGVYMLCSTLAALTGLLYLARSGVGDHVLGDGAELLTITAVISEGQACSAARAASSARLAACCLWA
jgi:ribose transport system permease protein